MSGGDVGIAGTESDEKIRCVLIKPGREWPLWQHEASHARLARNLVVKSAVVQVRDVGLRESHGRCYALPPA